MKKKKGEKKHEERRKDLEEFRRDMIGLWEKQNEKERRKRRKEFSTRNERNVEKAK